ncbi:hypothetical protein NMY22_g15641 [Coprinellus aureogranulatus]|nr:hypothetical protein NMY22_g15641 [Coprinellus aureogranulatus]
MNNIARSSPVPLSLPSVYSNHSSPEHPSIQSAPSPCPCPNPQAIASASPTSPITQTRQVHLMCGGKIACTATSIVRITSPEIAHLFLEEKYAIGQMFRRLEKVPAFELLSVGLGRVVEGESDKANKSFFADSERGQKAVTDSKDQLWRKYKLVIPDFECEILEVFPSRRMFVDGEAWLTGATPGPAPSTDTGKEYGLNLTLRLSVVPQRILLMFMVACVLVATFEGALLYSGRPVNCRRQ